MDDFVLPIMVQKAGGVNARPLCWLNYIVLSYRKLLNWVLEEQRNTEHQPRNPLLAVCCEEVETEKAIIDIANHRLV